MSSHEEQVAQRQAHLDALRALGIAVYPHKFERSHTVSELVAAHESASHDALEESRPHTTTSGRILGIRSFGKANFLVISDGVQRIQIYVRQDSVPSLDFQLFKLL